MVVNIVTTYYKKRKIIIYTEHQINTKCRTISHFKVQNARIPIGAQYEA